MERTALKRNPELPGWIERLSPAADLSESAVDDALRKANADIRKTALHISPYYTTVAAQIVNPLNAAYQIQIPIEIHQDWEIYWWAIEYGGRYVGSEGA